MLWLGNWRPNHMLCRLNTQLCTMDTASLKYLLLNWTPRNISTKQIRNVKRGLKREILRREVMKNSIGETK